MKKDPLNEQRRLRVIDRENMLGVIQDSPRFFSEALSICKKFPPLGKKRPKNIVISGMGGSAISGDIAATCLWEEGVPIPVFVNRDYRPPLWVDKQTLFIAVSYSGNTEETLASLQTAQKKGAEILTLSSGGKLQEIALKKGFPHLLIPKGFQPRAALPFLLTPLLYLLSQKGLYPSFSKHFQEALKVFNYASSHSAKQLASRLKGVFPVIFESRETAASALRFKNQLNENSKTMAL